MIDVLLCVTVAGDKPGPHPMDPSRVRDKPLPVYLTAAQKEFALSLGGSTWIASLVENELQKHLSSGTKLANNETSNLQIGDSAVESTNR